MSSYTPTPYSNSHHIEGYGLHGPVVDGLLIARDIVADVVARESDPLRIEVKIMREIDRAIERTSQ